MWLCSIVYDACMCVADVSMYFYVCVCVLHVYMLFEKGVVCMCFVCLSFLWMRLYELVYLCVCCVYVVVVCVCVRLLYDCV